MGKYTEEDMATVKESTRVSLRVRVMARVRVRAKARVEGSVLCFMKVRAIATNVVAYLKHLEGSS